MSERGRGARAEACASRRAVVVVGAGAAREARVLACLAS